MDTGPCSDEEQIDIVISDEDDFVVQEIQTDSNGQETDRSTLLEPTKGMLFDSEDSASCFYESYARKMGFGVIKRGSKKTDDGKVRYFTLACRRQGKAQYTSNNKFRPNPSTRQQCPAKVNFYLHGEKFCISSLMLDHNHDVSPSKERHLRCHKKLDLQAKRRLELNDQAGIVGSGQGSEQTNEYLAYIACLHAVYGSNHYWCQRL